MGRLIDLSTSQARFGLYLDGVKVNELFRQTICPWDNDFMYGLSLCVRAESKGIVLLIALQSENAIVLIHALSCEEVNPHFELYPFMREVMSRAVFINANLYVHVVSHEVANPCLIVSKDKPIYVRTGRNDVATSSLELVNVRNAEILDNHCPCGLISLPINHIALMNAAMSEESHNVCYSLLAVLESCDWPGVHVKQLNAWQTRAVLRSLTLALVSHCLHRLEQVYESRQVQGFKHDVPLKDIMMVGLFDHIDRE